MKRRPSRVVRLACHLADSLERLASENNVTRSQAHDAIVEDFFRKNKRDQNAALLANLAKTAHAWKDIRKVERDEVTAINAMNDVRSVEEYLDDLRES